MAADILNVTINFDANISKVVNDDDEWTTSGQTYGISTWVLLPFVVTLSDGYVLDTVVVNSTRAALNTKTDTQFTLSDISAANYEAEITLTSKAATTTVTLSAGIYIFKEVPATPSFTSGYEVPLTFTYTDSEETLSCTKIFFATDEDSGDLAMNYYTYISDGNEYVSEQVYIFESDFWNHDWFKIITVTADQSVPEDFYNWFTANTTAQSSKLSVDLTTLSGWANLTPGNHTIKIVAKGTGYRDSEKSAGVSVTKGAAVTYENVTLGKVDAGGQIQGGSYVSTGRCRISNADKTKYYIVVVKEVGGLPYYTSSGYFYWDATSSTWKFTTPNNIYSFTRDGGATIDFSAAPQGSEGAFDGWVDNCCVCVSSDSRPENADYDAIFAAYTKQSIAYYVCIIEGTLITLADGTKKPVEDITYNDYILCWDFYKGELASAKPAWIITPHIADCYNLCEFSNGAEVGFVGMGGTDGYHRIYNDEAKAFTHTGVPETPIGTTTFAEDGTFPKLVEQQIVKKEVKFYNIGTEKHFNLFTNGILTSSRISNCYKIKDMKYYGEQLIPDEEIAEYIEKKRNY